MAEQLVDYAEYKRYYSAGGRLTRSDRPVVNPSLFNRGFVPPQGSFAVGLLTPAGVLVRKTLVEFLGRPPRHQGVAKGRVYFKWLLEKGEDEDRAPYLVASDWVRDQGYEVELVWMESGSGNHYVKFVVRW